MRNRSAAAQLAARRRPPQQLILLLHGWRRQRWALRWRRWRRPLRGRYVLDASGARYRARPTRRRHRWRQATDGDSRGRQWYSIAGLTPRTGPARVDAALPPLQRLGARAAAPPRRRPGGDRARRLLAGRDPGAGAGATAKTALAGRVLAFGGCFTAPPQAAPRLTTMHLFHGARRRGDPAPTARARRWQWLGELQGDATLDIADGVGHTLHPALIDCALHRLQHATSRCAPGRRRSARCRRRGDPTVADD